MKAYFDHERLDVYRDAIAFCGWAGELISVMTARAAVKDQLDRASTSIPLNIAEGNGKFSEKDRARYFEIARGSALECAACLDVLVVRKLASADDAAKRERAIGCDCANAHRNAAQVFRSSGCAPRGRSTIRDRARSGAGAR
jgi:four helix bundle protein